MRFSPAVVTFVGRKSDGKVVPVYDIRMPDMLHSGERLLLWPWSGVECSKSEQRNNAEYILANKKLVPTPQPPKSASFFHFFDFLFSVDFSTRLAGNCGKSFCGSLPAHFVCTCRQFATEKSS